MKIKSIKVSGSLILAAFALVFTGILGGVAPIFLKVALREFTPFEIVFTRFFFAFIILFPILLAKKGFRVYKKDFVRILFASLFFAGNIFLFIFGLQYTTSISSQLLYLLTPTLVIILSFFFLKTRVQIHHLISIITGLLGGVILIGRNTTSVELINSLGTAYGNLIVLGAVCSWAGYIMVTKKLSSLYSPLFLLACNCFVTAGLSVFFLLRQHNNIFSIYHGASLQAILSLIALITLNSIAFFFLFQWAIKRVSPFMASTTTYFGPLSAAFFGVLLLGEKITIPLITSAFFICISAFFTFVNKIKT